MNSKDIIENLLLKADIKINGSRPWDITVHNNEVFDHILRFGTLGIGETYMDGLWDCKQLDEMINKAMVANIPEKLSGQEKLSLVLKKIQQIINPQKISKVKKDVPFHYDKGNLLFENMLDKHMTYTCAYWKNAEDLDQAQENKLNLVCKKLNLKPSMNVLDIGCGWGSFMKFASENYQVQCDGLTLSKEQKKLGETRCKHLPVNFILNDYREFDPNKQYDRIVSIGMLEHVGPKNYHDFFRCAHKLMKDDGVFLLHTIGGFASVQETDPWIKKYIFPNGVIPSLSQLGCSMEKKFIVEDLHNIGPNYDKTLMAWYNNFHKNWKIISDHYDERFYRMWKFYLLSCAGSFRSRVLNTWQFALTKIGTPYHESVRSV